MSVAALPVRRENLGGLGIFSKEGTFKKKYSNELVIFKRELTLAA